MGKEHRTHIGQRLFERRQSVGLDAVAIQQISGGEIRAKDVIAFEFGRGGLDELSLRRIDGMIRSRAATKS